MPKQRFYRYPRHGEATTFALVILRKHHLRKQRRDQKLQTRCGKSPTCTRIFKVVGLNLGYTNKFLRLTSWLYLTPDVQNSKGLQQY